MVLLPQSKENWFEKYFSALKTLRVLRNAKWKTDCLEGDWINNASLVFGKARSSLEIQRIKIPFVKFSATQIRKIRTEETNIQCNIS